MVSSSDHTKILRQWNFKNLPDNDNGDNLNYPLQLDEEGKYVINYQLPPTASILLSTGYYNSNDPEYINFRTINSSQEILINTFLSPQSFYSSFFSDVANIAFQESAIDEADIVFMQNDGDSPYFPNSLPLIEDIAGYSHDYYDPVKNINSEKQYGDIILNEDNFDGWNSTTPGSAQYHTVMHEIAHSLGLRHPEPDVDNQQYTIMSSNHAPGMSGSGTTFTLAVQPLSLQLLDIKALQSIYGANTLTRNEEIDGDPLTTGTTYKIGQGFADENTPFLYTIWDGGGTTDTIDASGYNDGVQIDLREGHFSSIGIKNDFWITPIDWDTIGYDAGNVAIAYGTEIENAIGTQYNDSFILNGLGNTIDGAGGNDTVYYYSSVFSSPVNIDLSTQSDDAGNILINIERIEGDAVGNVVGSTNSEEIVGNDLNNIITGAGGNDALYGGAGDDTLAFDSTDAANYSYADGGDGYDWFEISGGTDAVLDNGTVTTQSGTSENVEAISAWGSGYYYMQNLGWEIDLNHEYRPFLDYSAIQQSLYFNIDGMTSWSINETEGASPAADTLFNMGVASGHPYGPRFAGTNYGDTFDFRNVDFHYNVDPVIELGSGNDTVNAYMNASNDTEFVFNYRGGDDVINFIGYGAYNVMSYADIWMAKTIDHSDITAHKNNLTLVSSTSYRTYSFDLVLDILGNGSITIDGSRYEHRAGTDGIYDTADDTYRYYTPEIRFVDGGAFDRLSATGFEYIAGGNPPFVNWSMTSQAESITGTSGHDIIRVYGGDDTVYGGDDWDEIYGYGGNDTLYGESGSDHLYGGLGNDILIGGEDNDGLFGNHGVDELYGGQGLDVLRGENGNDILNGGADNDAIYGGFGDDTYLVTFGDGNDTLTETSGDNDVLKFTGGILFADLSFTKSGDNLVVNYATDSVTITDFYLDAAFMVEKIEFDSNPAFDASVLLKSDEDNNLVGTDVAEILYGGLGNDTVDYSNSSSGVSVDLLNGTASNSYAQGDILVSIENTIGSENSDIIQGSNEDNKLYGNGGDDTLLGGLGDDSYYYTSGEITIYETDGNDTIYLPEGVTSSNIAFLRYVGALEDLVIQIDDNDGDPETILGKIKVVNQFFDPSSLPSGNTQVETIVFYPDNPQVLTDQYVTTFGGEDGDVIYGIGYGANPNDTIYGFDTGDVIDAGGGNDFVYGGVGQDYIWGGDGIDALYGDQDGDWIYGGNGNDVIFGDQGDDPNSVNYTGDDHLYGDAGVDWIEGHKGSDHIYGGDDGDIIQGNEGNDFLYGDDGDDYIWGQEGDDFIVGGIGADNLSGHSGADTFAWLSGDVGAIDTINDFSISDGDILDISDILTGYTEGTSDITEFVQITDNGTDSTLAVDIDGGGDSFVTIATLYGLTGETTTSLHGSENLNLETVIV